MGSCLSNKLIYDSTTNPAEWSQQQILSWLQYSCNGDLKDLIKPFKKQKICGLTFTKLTTNALQNELGINEYGLREEFILQRNKLISNYNKQLHPHISNSKSQSHDQPKTPSSNIVIDNNHQTEIELLNHHISNTQNTENTENTAEKSENSEHEESPLLIIPNAKINIITKYRNRIQPQIQNNDQSIITEDDCFIEPLVPPRYSVDTDYYMNYTQTNMNNEMSPSSQSCPVHRNRMLHALHHGWKNASAECLQVNDIKWTKIKNRDNDLDLDLALDDQSVNIGIHDYTFMDQYDNNSYIGGSKLVINGFIRNMIGIDIVNTSIYELCFKYYYDNVKHIFQFGYDLYLILNKLQKKEYINNSNEYYEAFNGSQLVIEMRKTYFNKYRFGNIISYCNDILSCKYIQCIAKRKGASKLANISDFNNTHLYTFNQTKQRTFKRYYNFTTHNMDRIAWNRGTEVEIYSSSCNGWKRGEITKIGTKHKNVIVSYHSNVDTNKYLLKTVKRNEKDLLRSTREFIVARNKWKIGTKIEIYSHGDKRWYNADIYEIINMDDDDNDNDGMIDAFRVRYKRKNQSYYSKCIKHWSPDARDIQIIKNKKLLKYKSGINVEIYSNTKKKWIKGCIKDVLPKHEYIVVDSKGIEYLIDVNSGCIRIAQ